MYYHNPELAFAVFVTAANFIIFSQIMPVYAGGAGLEEQTSRFQTLRFLSRSYKTGPSVSRCSFIKAGKRGSLVIAR